MAPNRAGSVGLTVRTVVVPSRTVVMLVTVPWGAAATMARLTELLPDPPLTRDQIELLKRDNVVDRGAAGLPELGIMPTPLEVIVPSYLRQYAGLGLRLPVA